MAVGCKKTDNTNPIAMFVGSQDTVAVAGTDFNLIMNFSDNSNLNSYRVEISGHPLNSNINAFNYVNVGELSGVSKKVIETILIPEFAIAGEYTISVVCIDDEGNASEVASIDLDLFSYDQPFIILQSITPAFAMPGDSISFVFSVDANSSITSIKYSVTEPITLINKTINFTDTSLSNVTITDGIRLDSNVALGIYNLNLVAVDSSGHYSFSNGIFEIKQSRPT